MFHFFKPRFIDTLITRLIKPLTVLSALCFVIGVVFALFISPPDYQQGESVRMMYVHVPSAWIALMGYLVLALCGISYLVWRNPLSFFMAKAAAPVGMVFCLITLVTGMLWGKPIWGVWWVWDARLTSMLILFLLYVGYIALADALKWQEKAAFNCSVLAIIGLINLPIIKFSVEWWNTLHQPASIMRSGGVAIDTDMLIPLLTIYASFTGLYISLVLIRTKTILLENKRHKKRYHAG